MKRFHATKNHKLDLPDRWDIEVSSLEGSSGPALLFGSNVWAGMV